MRVHGAPASCHSLHTAHLLCTACVSYGVHTLPQSTSHHLHTRNAYPVLPPLCLGLVICP